MTIHEHLKGKVSASLIGQIISDIKTDINDWAENNFADESRPSVEALIEKIGGQG